MTQGRHASARCCFACLLPLWLAGMVCLGVRAQGDLLLGWQGCRTVRPLPGHLSLELKCVYVHVHAAGLVLFFHGHRMV